MPKYRKKSGRVARLSDRSLSITHEARSGLLRKAIVEQFCTRFAPGSVVVYIRDQGGKCIRPESEPLARLGVVLNSPVRLPDLIVHAVAKNWLLLIEAVVTHGPVDAKRHEELTGLFKGCTAGLVFITVFENRDAMRGFVSQISWKTEVWLADEPDHLIHFNGERFLGPHEE